MDPFLCYADSDNVTLSGYVELGRERKTDTMQLSGGGGKTETTMMDRFARPNQIHEYIQTAMPDCASDKNSRDSAADSHHRKL